MWGLVGVSVSRPSWFVARYVADLLRDEPVNVGVIVDSGAGAAGLFGVLPSVVSLPPHFVASHVGLYATWRDLVRRRMVVHKEFGNGLQALNAVGRRVFRIEARGELVAAVSSQQVEVTVARLFARVVARDRAAAGA